MNKNQLLKTIDTVENTFASLRGVIDDVYNDREKLEKEQEENARVRNDIINTQRKVLRQVKGFKEEEEKIQKKKESLKSQEVELTRKEDELQRLREQLGLEEKRIKEKMEVAKNLDKWTADLESKEQLLVSREARLRIKKEEFEVEKEKTDRQNKINKEFKLKLDRRENELKAREARASRILND